MADDISEIWKPIGTFEDIYEVSNIGRVRRSYDAPAARASTPGIILKTDASTGYDRVSLTRDGVSSKHLVHRLVAAAFIGPRPLRQVNHIDGNKRNNVLSNLEYVTAYENVTHAWRTGLCHARGGADHHSTHLDDRDVSIIRKAIALGVKGATLADVFGVTETAISAIKRSETWPNVKPIPSTVKESAA